MQFSTVLCSIALFYFGELCVLAGPCTQHLSRLSNLHFIHGLFLFANKNLPCCRDCTHQRVRVHAHTKPNIALLHYSYKILN